MTTPPYVPVEVPPRYPREFERRLTLQDGRTVLIRPIVPADAAQLAEAIRAADPDTLRRRFLGGPPRVTPALLEHLTTIDYVRRFALVALDPATGRGVAVGRYEPLSEGVAEIAVVVDPAWRRVGLATMLVELLAEAALARGIHEFSVFYLAENRPVAALLAHAAGAGKQMIRQGLADWVVALDRGEVAAAPQPPDRPAPRPQDR
jgi:RimJ/RimL family protein N-acetyltransferase